jgi:hypothetical protein
MYRAVKTGNYSTPKSLFFSSHSRPPRIISLFSSSQLPQRGSQGIQSSQSIWTFYWSIRWMCWNSSVVVELVSVVLLTLSAQWQSATSIEPWILTYHTMTYIYILPCLEYFFYLVYSWLDRVSSSVGSTLCLSAQGPGPALPPTHKTCLLSLPVWQFEWSQDFLYSWLTAWLNVFPISGPVQRCVTIQKLTGLLYDGNTKGSQCHSFPKWHSLLLSIFECVLWGPRNWP